MPTAPRLFHLSARYANAITAAWLSAHAISTDMACPSELQVARCDHSSRSGLSQPVLPQVSVIKIRPRDLAREIYVSSARTSPVLKSVIQDYASKVGITLKAEYEGENLPAAMSLVTSTGGVTLIPLYPQNMLTPNVVARALDGVPPTIDLTLGYNEARTPPLLLKFLSRADELVASVQDQSVSRYAL